MHSPVSRHLILTLALLTSAQAQSSVPITPPTSAATSAPANVSSPVQAVVLPVSLEDRLVLTSTDIIRYAFDPLTSTLTLPNFTLSAQAPLPNIVTWRQQGPDALLVLKPGTQITLNPDNRQLTLLPPRAASAAVTDDIRAPLIIPLSNADPVVVSGLLSRLYSNVRVEVDARQHALLVLVNPADRQLILDFIRQLDTTRPQVMFEAQIIEINSDMTQSLGINYDSIFNLKLTEGDTPSLTSIGTFNRSPLSLSIGLNALKTSGAAKVLAQPRITTLDGVQAVLNSTQTTPLVLPGGSSSPTTVQNITTGITLRLTPRITPDGLIEASLTINVSTPTGTTSQGVTQFSTREASTTVRVKNGEPIAIGGLYETRKIEGAQKVPLLGDIPLLGALFTTTRTDIHNTDLVIIVTPRLVTSAEPETTVVGPPAPVQTGK